MKSILHSFILIFIFSFSTISYSQQRGNHQNSSQPQGQSNGMTQGKINPKNMAKIIIYDEEEVLKKLKIKKAPKQAAISKALWVHNNKINELKTFNYETFNNVKLFLTKKRNEAMLNRDFVIMKEAQMEANEMLSPIRSKVITQQNILNTTFERELTEKQYKKWLKYQQGELKKLKPKKPERPQMQSRQRSQGRGQR